MNTAVIHSGLLASDYFFFASVDENLCETSSRFELVIWELEKMHNGQQLGMDSTSMHKSSWILQDELC